jgi:hypothetical protein
MLKVLESPGRDSPLSPSTPERGTREASGKLNQDASFTYPAERSHNTPKSVFSSADVA